jgi:predicted nucleotidyltransferase
MAQFGWVNCPEDGRTQIAALLEGLQEALGDRLVSVVLHGSLAMNCFNPRRSDLDLLVVTRTALPLTTKRRLALLMLKSSRKPYPVEVSIIDQAVLHPWKYPTPFEFHFSEEWRQAFNESILEGGTPRTLAEDGDPDLAAHVAIARRRGVALFGPEPAELFPVIPEEDYLDSILRNVTDDLYGLTIRTGQPVYAILNACRVYAHLRTEQIYSKAEGGEWALHGLPARHHPLIQQALKYYRGDTDDRDFPREGLQEFVDFMRTDFDRFALLSGGQDGA